MPSSPNHPVTVAGRRLASPRHICCFFDSRDQQYDVLVPYFAEGLANGEQLLTITDSDVLPDHLGRLAAGGIDTEAARGSGQLCALCTDETYLAGGVFAKKRMHEALQRTLQENAAGPFTGLRTCGDMRWALRNMPGTGELLEYESEVNGLLDGHNATFLCVYDAARISGRAMLDILGTHSHVLLGDVVHENAYYLPPEQYRQTILARRASSAGLTDDQAPNRSGR
jgi:hypothetical protein